MFLIPLPPLFWNESQIYHFIYKYFQNKSYFKKHNHNISDLTKMSIFLIIVNCHCVQISLSLTFFFFFLLEIRFENVNKSHALKLVNVSQISFNWYFSYFPLSHFMYWRSWVFCPIGCPTVWIWLITFLCSIKLVPLLLACLEN